MVNMPAPKGQLMANRPLADLTWMRVGGPADFFFLPKSKEDLLYFVLQSLKSQKIKPEKSKLNYIFNHKLLGLQDFTKKFIKDINVLFNSDDKSCDYIF